MCLWVVFEARSRHITHYQLRFYNMQLHSHERGTAHVICKSQNRGSWREPLHRSLSAKGLRPKPASDFSSDLKQWAKGGEWGGREFASEPQRRQSSNLQWNGKKRKERNEKRWERGWKKREHGQLIRHSSERSGFLSVELGRAAKLQMHWTAGYFPLPWPAKESSFKTHLPVNILAWLWVISPVCSRASRAWRCTCTQNPKMDLVTSDFPFSPTAPCFNCCDPVR